MERYVSGLKLIVPMSFKDTKLPVLSNDPVLAKGSLALFEPAHPAEPWGSGVPVSGFSIPNIATESFQKITGASPENSRGVYTKDSNITSAEGVVKRTPKGGLEVIMSDTVAATPYRYVMMSGGASLADYLIANYDHNYYGSVWKKNTRGGRSGAYPYVYAAGNEASQLNNIFSYQTSVIPSANSQPERLLGANRSDSFVAVGSGLWAIGAKGGGGTPTKAAMHYGYRWTTGNNSHSAVVYRIYLEDLTVSGRTFAEALAADDAEHTKQVLTAGGRYFGDTNTNPTTVP